MSILTLSSINRRLFKLQSVLIFEAYDAHGHGPEAVLAQLDRLWADPDKAKAMGPHFGEVLRGAMTRQRAQGSSSTEDQVAEWIERTLPSGFFVSTVSAIPGEPPHAYAKRVRRSLHDLARSLGIHFRFVVVAAWQKKMRRSHAHCIVELPNVVDGPYSLVSMAIHMVEFLPDGEVAIYPRVPYGGDAKYIVDHLDSERGMETLTVGVGCPGGDGECRGRCVVTRNDRQFCDGSRYLRDYVPVPVVGVIRDGVFTPRGRKMNKDTTKRLKAQKKAARETARGIREWNRDAKASKRSAAPSKASTPGDATEGLEAVQPRKRKKAPRSAPASVSAEAHAEASVEGSSCNTGGHDDLVTVARRSSTVHAVPTLRLRRPPTVPPNL